MIKRSFDLIASLFVILTLGWLIFICYIISIFVHKSNGFFLQERVGKNGKAFKIFKLKSMKVVKNAKSATTLENDPRVTRFGRFIRKTKIDELPQIINVLIGEMSIVGPRPTVFSDYYKMNIEQRKRFEVKPGITGLAQINGNTSIQWPKRIKFDIEYINKQSFFLDIKIIIKTLILVLSNKADTHPATNNEWE